MLKSGEEAESNHGCEDCQVETGDPLVHTLVGPNQGLAIVLSESHLAAIDSQSNRRDQRANLVKD